MSKRLLAMVIAIVMLVGVIPTTFALASSSSATLTVKTNKTTVNPGDEVEFSVELSQTGNIAAIEAYVDLPDGLTLISGSLAATTDKATLGWDDFTVDESYLMIYGYGSKGYEGTALTLATFKCIVDADAEGQLVVDLFDVSALDEMMEDKHPTSVSATINVEILVTGVTLDKDTLALDTGDNSTATLIATVDPNKATDKTVIWKSSDETVATVVDGVVTAVKHGTVTITVQTVDGGFTDVCIVTVTCVHSNKIPTAEKTANCQQGGWNEYYTCDDCNQLFDADAMTKIDSVPTTDVDATNHTNEKNFDADEATCVHQGNDAYTKCLDCGIVTAGSDVKYYGEHDYGELKVATTEIHTATELKPTVAAHYQCSVCQKYFTEGKLETTLEALTGTTPSHSYGDWVNTDASKHWKECACGKQIENADHDFDNTCDTTCNTCGYVRTITHTWGDTWYTDGENHWKECSVCHNARTEEGAHTGGTATCQTVRECTVCHLNYGDLAGCDFVEYVADEYLVTEATCVSAAVYKKSCSVCGSAHETETFKHGTVDATNHIGGTYIEGDKKSDCVTPGYTGDIKCNSCHQVITYGTDLPLASHVPASNWSTDGTHHWKECLTVGCDHEIDKDEHTGGTATCKSKAVCSVCQAEYGEIDPTNHVGGTYVEGQRESDCVTPGYTGDVKCNSCHQVITYGSDLPLAPDVPSSEWSKDATHHWKECLVDGCINEIDKAEHTGGIATCKSKAVCSVCQAEYGEIDASKHVGETEVKGAKIATCDEPGYTGDIWCKDCNTKIKDGQEIAASHKTTEVPEKKATHTEAGNIKYYTCSNCTLLFTDAEGKNEIKIEDTVVAKVEHNYGNTYVSDGKNHWKECECGDKTELGAHTGGSATCYSKKKCTVCKASYGSYAYCNYIENPIAKYLVSDATCSSAAVYKLSCYTCGTAHPTETFTHGKVDADNHVGATYVKGQKNADCVTSGYTGDTYCKDCNAKIKTGKTIPTTHEIVEIAATEATHTATGNIKHYACSICSLLFADAEAKTEITQKDIVVEKVEHNTSESYGFDTENHWKECECGEKVEAVAHDYGEWTVTREATAKENGLKEKSCSVCGHKVEEEFSFEKTTDTTPTGNTILWIVLAATSVCVVVVVIIFMKKRTK